MPNLKTIFLSSLGALTIVQGFHALPARGAEQVDPEAQIRATDARYSEAVDRKDVARTAAFYSEDAILINPGMKPIHGRGAIANYAKQLYSYPGFKVEITVDEVLVAASGDMAMSRNHYTAASTDPKTGKTVKESGNAIMIMDRQANGTWKIVREISSPAPSVDEAAHDQVSAR
jgi:uncharacterized protein (TIGR02246 family)